MFFCFLFFYWYIFLISIFLKTTAIQFSLLINWTHIKWNWKLSWVSQAKPRPDYYLTCRWTAKRLKLNLSNNWKFSISNTSFNFFFLFFEKQLLTIVSLEKDTKPFLRVYDSNKSKWELQSTTGGNKQWWWTFPGEASQPKLHDEHVRDSTKAIKTSGTTSKTWQLSLAIFKSIPLMLYPCSWMIIAILCGFSQNRINLWPYVSGLKASLL